MNVMSEWTPMFSQSDSYVNLFTNNVILHSIKTIITTKKLCINHYKCICKLNLLWSFVLFGLTFRKIETFCKLFVYLEFKCRGPKSPETP